jgi:protein-tyrosine phosphatase
MPILSYGQFGRLAGLTMHLFPLLTFLEIVVSAIAKATSTAGLASLNRRALLRGTAALGLSTLGASLLVACGGSDPEVIPDTPRLTSADNFRDVGGATDATAYVSSNGQRLRRGQLFRSNALNKLSAADAATLVSLQLKTVYDLRTDSEVTSSPDIVPTGATYVRYNILGSSALNPPLTTAAADIAWMEDLNRDFVRVASERTQIAGVIKAIAATPGVQLYHCTAGKDRAGWTSAVLQTILGMSSADIMSDYLLTNTYSAASIAATYAQLKTAYGQAMADAYMPLLGVQASFLNAGLTQAVTSYGSMDKYISDGLGIDSATVQTLRSRYLR